MRKMPSPAKKVTVQQIAGRKPGGRRIAMLTAYDFPTARIVDTVEQLDIILVGDSLGMEELGYETTIPVTMDDMVHHTRAVTRGARRALVLADMPFLSYQTGDDDAVRNAGRLIQEGGGNAVKLEGGKTVQGVIRRIVDAGIPVVGHIGLTPQSVNQIGMRVQGRDDEAARRILDDALAVQSAGAFAVVLELMPVGLAEQITRELTIPTIGIGSGPHCDGQVLVLSDMIGLDPDRTPFKHVRRYANVGETIRNAAAAFCADVAGGEFPGQEQSFT